MARQRVLLVDDHPVVCAGVGSLLQGNPAFELAGCCATADEALEAVHRDPPDIILIDYVLGDDGNGFDLARRLSGSGCRARLVLFTGHDHGRLLARTALAAGFSGYLGKYAAMTDLDACLAAVAAGGFWWDGPTESVAL